MIAKNGFELSVLNRACRLKVIKISKNFLRQNFYLPLKKSYIDNTCVSPTMKLESRKWPLWSAPGAPELTDQVTGFESTEKH